MISKEKRNTSKYVAITEECYDKIVKTKNEFAKKGVRLTIGSTIAVVFNKESKID